MPRALVKEVECAAVDLAVGVERGFEHFALIPAVAGLKLRPHQDTPGVNAVVAELFAGGFAQVLKSRQDDAFIGGAYVQHKLTADIAELGRAVVNLIAA